MLSSKAQIYESVLPVEFYSLSHVLKNGVFLGCISFPEEINCEK
jgi:hypothetical protein